MPPPIPETCGKWTCDHPKGQRDTCDDYPLSHYQCQEVKGECEVHDKEAIAAKIAARSREYLFRDRVDTPTPEEVEQRVKTEVLDALPTDDVLDLVTEQRDRAVELLKGTPCVVYATGRGAAGHSPWKASCPWCEMETERPRDSDALYEPVSAIDHKPDCTLNKFLGSLK